jgi:hypothetical protein
MWTDGPTGSHGEATRRIFAPQRCERQKAGRITEKEVRCSVPVYVMLKLVNLKLARLKT